VHICFPFVGDTVGGSHISSILVIKELRRRGHVVSVVVHADSVLDRHLIRNQIRVERIELNTFVGEHRSVILELRAFASSVTRLYCFIRKNQVDIVHTNDVRMHLTWFLAVKLSRRVQVWHQRTRFRQSVLEESILKRVGVVVAVSEVTKSSIQRFVNRSIRVIPNAVRSTQEPERRRLENSQSRVPSSKSEQTRIVGIFGTLRDLKRPEVALLGVAKAARLMNQVLVVRFIGEDREGIAPRLEALAEKSADYVQLEIMGFRSPIEPWIQECHVVVSASTDDAFGRTLIEAMAQGVPVVAACAGGHIEIISHEINGLLFEPDEEEDLGRQLVRLFSNEHLYKRVQVAGLETVEKRYTVERQVDSLVKVYQGSLKKRKIKSSHSSAKA
jgi:glycosyltransferase involved in cell wall biosynthesis